MAAIALCPTVLFGQERKDKTPVTYEELYDEPYSVNKLFVGLTPLYAELFVTNVNAGFGLDVAYYLKDKADFHASFRKTYSERFYDFNRNLSTLKSDVDNRSQVYNYYEIGGTYHIKDFEESSKTKVFLYKNSYKGDKWAARVPLDAEIPCKVRKIYGVRLGAIHWKSSADLSRILELQGLSNNSLVNVADPDDFLPETKVVTGRTQSFDVFSNINSTGIFLGGSLAWIKNVAVDIDKFEEGVDDLMLTVYADVIVSPVIKIDEVVIADSDPLTGDPRVRNYSVESIRTKSFGFRAGIDGRFNRTLSFAYGAEIGYRPSFEKAGFYAMLKISFPVFGTNLDYKVESFGK